MVMGQGEVVQALKNLGNKARRDDLIAEYFRLHFPDPIQRKELTENRNYKLGNALSRYLSKLRKNGTINYNVVKSQTKRWDVEYYFVNPEQSK